ncbi:MAG: ATP-grasp fold amidoligase family protein [Candidatus Dormibacteraeota bacterium]|nr:ATP-grasp fold amidoligase family protein [Candidatus Dormibacteraeota bacterium]
MRLREWLADAQLDGLRHLPAPLRRHLLYLARQRRWADLRHPTTFSEKINWRMLHDRRPLIGYACDKLWVKELAAGLGLATPETIWSGLNVRELLSLDLPECWVLKPNHRSGAIYFGRGQPSTADDLDRITGRWLAQNPELSKGEWGYSQARRTLLVEPLLGDGPQPPVDYKLFVFHQRPALLQIDSDRFSGHRRRLYTSDFRPLKTRLEFPLGPVDQPPDTWPEMVDAARRLAHGFDFVRVDLYNVNGAVYVGELAVYPGGGLERFVPRRLDIQLGSLWSLPTAAEMAGHQQAGAGRAGPR